MSSRAVRAPFSSHTCTDGRKPPHSITNTHGRGAHRRWFWAFQLAAFDSRASTDARNAPVTS